MRPGSCGVGMGLPAQMPPRRWAARVVPELSDLTIALDAGHLAWRRMSPLRVRWARLMGRMMGVNKIQAAKARVS